MVDNCEHILVPIGWIQNCDPLPQSSIVLVFLSFEILIMLGIWTIYRYSNIQKLNTPLFMLPQNTYGSSETLYRGIKIAYLGVFLMPFNNFLSHVALLVTPYQGYLMIGFSAYLIVLGAVLFGYGLYVFQTQFLSEMRTDLSNSISYYLKIILLLFTILLILPLPLEYLFPVALDDISRYFALAMLIPTIMLIVFLQRWVSYKNPIIELRFKIIIYIYFIFSVFLLMSSFFAPLGNDLPLEEHLTKQVTVEWLILVSNTLSVILSVLLLLLVRLPSWLRDYYGISNEDFQDYTYHKYGIDPPNTVIYNLEDIETFSPTTGLDDLLDEKYLLFENLLDEGVSGNLLKGAVKEKFPILKEFRSDNLKEEYFMTSIFQRTNLFFLINDLDENFNSILDIIYEEYNWEIELDVDSIQFNKFVFDLPDKEFALIFSGTLNQNANHVYLFLFKPELTEPMYYFISSFSDFLEDQTLVGPFVMILFFDFEQSELKKIDSEDHDPDVPFHKNFKIFRPKA